jgi:ribose transport system ATP-binding protein
VKSDHAVNPGGLVESDGLFKLSLSSVSKTYGNIRALDGVSFAVQRGHFHALLGGNGSGKSTLIKLLAGVAPGDGRGTITIDQAVTGDDRTTPEWAQEHGLAFVHQDLGLFEKLTVAENLFVGVDFPARHGLISWREIRERAATLLELFHLNVDPSSSIAELRPTEKTLIAVTRALRGRDQRHGGLLILDEPTARLPTAEVAQLREALVRLCNAGQTILYVTHRLEEVFEMADAVTVLRDGRAVATRTAEGLTKAELIALISGRNVGAIYPERPKRPGSEPLLEVRGLCGGPLHDISFDLHRGEILGIAGLVGSGRSSLLKMIFGLLKYEEGSIVVNGAPLAPGTSAAIQAGLAYVPEDRGVEGIFPDMSVSNNLAAAHPDMFLKSALYSEQREYDGALSVIDRLGIRAPGPDTPIQALSGGNQQKVVLGRWLRDATCLLVLDEPTQGVDVGARADLYAEISKVRRQGLGVIIASSDDDEILGLADRVIVLNRGRVVATASGPDLTQSWLSYHVHTSAAPAAAESEMSSRGALTQDCSTPRRMSSGVSESLRSKSTGRWLAYTERYALVILVFALVCLFSVMPSTSQTFLTLANLQGLALTQSVIAVAAIAATIPLLAGQFDVSIGPVLGMTSVVLAAATVRYQLPVPLSIMISVFAGGAVGAINGYIVAYLRTSSFIITLGTGTLVTGLVTLGTSNQTITDAPQSLVDFGSRSALGIPWLGWVLCTVAVLIWFFLRYTVPGRRLALVGSNRAAATIVGVRVNQTVFLSFVASGLLAGLAGVLLFAQVGAANPQAGVGYTLPALAAAFLGATTLRPGHFNILGTIVGVFFVGLAVDGLTLAGAADWVQPVFDGAGLVVAVVLSSVLARQSNKRGPKGAA